MRTRYGNEISGYTLPTVLVTVFIMFAVMVFSLQLVSTTNNALDERYYQQLAREAARSGYVYMKECLARDVDNIPVGEAIKPNSNCDGSPSSASGEYIYEDEGKFRTSFSAVYTGLRDVGGAGSQVYEFEVVGVAERLRPHGNSGQYVVAEDYKYTISEGNLVE